MVELTRARGIEAVVGDVRNLPFAAGSFDSALAAWMLFHVEEVDAALSELARVLRPGGRLVVVTNGERSMYELRDALGAGPLLDVVLGRERRGAAPAPLPDGRAAGRVGDGSFPRPRRRAGLRRRVDHAPFRAAARRPSGAVRRHPRLRACSWPRRDPAGRADPAQARRRRARRSGARRPRARVRPRRGARLPAGGVLHGRLLPRALGGRDVRAHRRDGSQRRDDRPRGSPRAAGRRQALDRRRGGQDDARRRPDRRRLRRAVREDERSRARAYRRHPRQARVDPRLPRRADERAVRRSGAGAGASRSSGRPPISSPPTRSSTRSATSRPPWTTSR